MGEYDVSCTIEDLPGDIPIFPLNGVLLLPHGQLPLNIFEPRYKAMVDAALKGQRMIGIVQPRYIEGETGPDDTELFRTGCAGKITSFEETVDGRYIVILSGICRFNIIKELSVQEGYRRIVPDWMPYRKDMEHVECLDMDRKRLHILLADYFERHDISCDWNAIDKAPDNKLITCLAMICPFGAPEKQALLEAGCCFERAKLFLAMLEMAVHGHDEACSWQH